MKIYTRRGDDGDTGLYGGGRVPKHHPRVEAYGTIDEMNSLLGSALLRVQDPASRERLGRVQHDLFSLGAHLATAPAASARGSRSRLPSLPGSRVAEMEEWIDEAGEELEPLDHFVLPGGSEGAAALHHCRTVCRRAERRVVSLDEGETGPLKEIVRYLNRLSDLLFVLARLENRRAGLPDTIWSKPAGEDRDEKAPDGDAND